jgi:hypothetical protein
VVSAGPDEDDEEDEACESDGIPPGFRTLGGEAPADRISYPTQGQVSQGRSAAATTHRAGPRRSRSL